MPSEQSETLLIGKWHLICIIRMPRDITDEALCEMDKRQEDETRERLLCHCDWGRYLHQEPANEVAGI